jgi:hypothetical protein
MTIDHFTMYTVYKVFYVYYFKAGQIINGDWRKLIIKYFLIHTEIDKVDKLIKNFLICLAI